jgi:hypothetical protein
MAREWAKILDTILKWAYSANQQENPGFKVPDANQ